MSSSAHVDEWCLIESDPGVFTQLCNSLDVNDVEFKELYGTDEGSFAALENDEVASLTFNERQWLSPDHVSSGADQNRKATVFGLIFLFKWARPEAGDTRQWDMDPSPNLFFAKQVVQNACATQAILSVLFNRSDIALGSPLECEKAYIMSQGSSGNSSIESLAERRGGLLGESNTIRKAHESFKATSALEFVDTQRDNEKGGEAFHYVSYVPVDGKVYELDGLQKAPITHGECTMENWLSVVRPEITRRMMEGDQNDTGGDIRFNLLAVVADQTKRIKRVMDVRRHIRQLAALKAMSFGSELQVDDEIDEDAPPGVPDIEALPDSLERLTELVDECNLTIPQLKELYAREQIKRAEWAEENARRKHDWTPFILKSLELLAKQGTLSAAFTNALQSKKAGVKSKKTSGDNDEKMETDNV